MRYTAPPRWFRRGESVLRRVQWAGLVVLVFAVAPWAATASQQGVIVSKKWQAMDACAKHAQTTFPDFTPEANAKREALLQACLAGQNLPPREQLSPRQ